MCAIVPCTSFVVTLPVIVPSSATRKLPEPEPGVLILGGTSSAPESFTLIAPLPGIQAGTLSRYRRWSSAVIASGNENFRYDLHRLSSLD